MFSQDIDESSYYDINGDKICDRNGKRILIHIYGESVQDLETGELFSLRDDTISSEEDNDSNDDNEDIVEFSYSLFAYNLFLCIISKIYDFVYNVKNREL